MKVNWKHGHIKGDEFDSDNIKLLMQYNKRFYHSEWGIALDCDPSAVIIPMDWFLQLLWTAPTMTQYHMIKDNPHLKDQFNVQAFDELMLLLG